MSSSELLPMSFFLLVPAVVGVEGVAAAAAAALVLGVAAADADGV